MKEITAYQSDDGKIFTTAEECKIYEKEKADAEIITAYMRVRFESSYFNTDADDTSWDEYVDLLKSFLDFYKSFTDTRR